MNYNDQSPLNEGSRHGGTESSLSRCESQQDFIEDDSPLKLEKNKQVERKKSDEAHEGDLFESQDVLLLVGKEVDKAKFKS